MMRPHSIASRCLRVLRDGPATTGEIAAELGLASRDICTGLCSMYRRGKLLRQRFLTGTRQVRWLWQLPEQRQVAA